MAAPVLGPFSSSAASLLLALALVALSLWRVDRGFMEHQVSARSGGDNAVTSLVPFDPQPDWRSHLHAASVEDLVFGSWGGIRVPAENKEARRKATVALVVYATGDGIRR